MGHRSRYVAGVNLYPQWMTPESPSDPSFLNTAFNRIAIFTVAGSRSTSERSGGSSPPILDDRDEVRLHHLVCGGRVVDHRSPGSPPLHHRRPKCLVQRDLRPELVE